jgi:hypothetical protein
MHDSRTTKSWSRECERSKDGRALSQIRQMYMSMLVSLTLGLTGSLVLTSKSGVEVCWSEPRNQEQNSCMMMSDSR